MLKKRIMSGLLLGVGGVLTVNYASPLVAWALLILISALAQAELYGLFSARGIPVFRVVGLLCGTALITATFFTISADPADMARAYQWEQLVLMGSLIAVFVRQFPQKHNDRPVATIACTLLGVWYVPYLLNFFSRLALSWDAGAGAARLSATGRTAILYLIVIVKLSDVGAYCIGRLFGRHKLFPRVSPGKTWEGLFGGLAAAIAASLVFQVWCGGALGDVEFGRRDAVLLGLLLAIVGVVGDMFESLLKRAAGAKDSGSFIPGMGGLLDVLDSLLFGAPVLYVYLRFLS